MNAFIRFNKGFLHLPLRVQLYMVALVGLNMIAPLFFIQMLEAQIVLGAFMASFALMIILTGMVGFTRLLGLAHIFWIPMLFFVWPSLEVYPAQEAVGIWLRLLIILNVIALVLDAVDISRYIRGNRSEMDLQVSEGDTPGDDQGDMARD